MPLFPTKPFAFVAHYFMRRPLGHFTLLGLVMGGAAAAVGVQYAMKMLIDAMGSEQRALDPVWFALALFMGLIALENLCGRLSGVVGSRTIIATGVDIRLDVYHHLSGHSARYFSDNMTGSLGNRVTQCAGVFGAIAGTLSWGIVPPLADFAGAVIVLLTIDWRMAVALIVAVVVTCGGLAWAGIWGKKLHQDHAATASRLEGEVVDIVSNNWAVKAFTGRSRERARLAEKFKSEASAHRRSWMFTEKMRVGHDVALWVMAGSMLAYGIHLWGQGAITAGSVVIVSALTFRILHGSRDLAFALVGIVQEFGALADSLEVVAKPHEVADAPEARPLIHLGGAVAFEDISFTYASGRRVFENFTLKVEPGQKVGIVGPSGAGKSTLISLLQRLEDIGGGRILVDGQPISTMTQDSLRAAIAVVPQEISLFHRTVMENIRYGRPDASDEEVVAAARAARCHDFITAMPQGYDTPVGERGTKLSGGQRQRLGIARALLKNAPIILLDEATSALDTESEIEIQKALAELMRGRTVLAVAHRLSTVAAFDRIVVMADGKIVEDGSPKDLRQSRGIFDAMWRMQAEGFLNEEVFTQIAQPEPEQTEPDPRGDNVVELRRTA